MWRLKGSANILATVAFGWVLLDALLNYFLMTFIGSTQRVNALLPAFVFLLILTNGWRAVSPPLSITIALAFAVAGFSIGPLVAEISTDRYIELSGALCAFAIGYSYIRWHEDENSFLRLLLIISGMYVTTCVLALAGIAPNIFPLKNQVWSYNGLLVSRPYMGINSNFQIFYVFPVALALVLPYRHFRFWTSFLLTLGAFFTLAKLQTRSGTLALIGTITLCFLAPLWDRQLGRQKLFLIVSVTFVILAIGTPWIVQNADLLLARFTDTDYGTGYGRLVGFMYLFEHLFDPTWWSPRGNEEFAQRYGGTESDVVPHSNITAMFLEGGIAGLYMWLAVFLAPLCQLVRLFFQKRLAPIQTTVMIGGICMMIVQLSLNVPFFKQPWLWAGAVVGALYHAHATSDPPERAQETIQYPTLAVSPPTLGSGGTK